jgi:transcriptional regulator with XRE-family HTH domain
MRSATLIREARLRAGLTQRELAERLDLPQQNISRWERGKVRPSFETLQDVLGACDLELALQLARRDDSIDPLLDQALARTPAERVQRLRERVAFKQQMRHAQT